MRADDHYDADLGLIRAEKVDSCIAVVREVGLVEIARTGLVAIARGPATR